ncbi:septum formation initiator family protein [Candidatus Berkelbacteria bacterium]|nr:septum formation initiator family protein [Candidatus Berkelbacteria bacterium]
MQPLRTPWPTIVGRIFLALAVAYVLVNLGRAIQKNSEINQAIHRLKEEIALLEERITLLAYEIAYEQSEAYRTLEAKRRLGLRAKGETVVLVPQNVDPPSEQAAPSLPARPLPERQPSFFDQASTNASTWLSWIRRTP